MTEPLRVALFSAYYPEHGGGIELVTGALARDLAKAGLTVEWGALRERGSFEVGDPQGLSRAALSGTNCIYRMCGIPVPLPSPAALVTIWRAVRRAQVVVIAEANFVVCMVAFVLARWFGRPVLLVQHVGAPSTVSALAAGIARVAELLVTRPMLRRADEVIYVSPVVARHFAAIRPVSGERGPARIVGPGIDAALFRKCTRPAERDEDRSALGLGNGESRPIAAFVGRLTVSKGIKVMRELARLRPDWQFVLAGTGPVNPGEWGLPNISVMGQLAAVDIARLFRAIDVMVLPSQSESFSLVVREALMSGAEVLCAEQILETDPGLAEFVTTAPVDLSRVTETGAAFAAALDVAAAGRASDAAEYVARRHGSDHVASTYVRLLRDLAVRDRQNTAGIVVE